MMKYRIKVRDSKDFPYGSQYKNGFFDSWHDIDIHETIDESERAIVQYQINGRHIPRAGTIVKTYDPIDVTALILKMDISE